MRRRSSWGTSASSSALGPAKITASETGCGPNSCSMSEARKSVAVLLSQAIQVNHARFDVLNGLAESHKIYVLGLVLTVEYALFLKVERHKRDAFDSGVPVNGFQDTDQGGGISWLKLSGFFALWRKIH